MLTWEYPPRIVGGLARHCWGLSKALARKGIEVHIVTLEFPGVPLEEEVNGVKIHRVKVEIGNPNFLVWVLLFNHFMEKRAGLLSREIGEFDIIHVHDWLTTLAGISLKHTLGKSLVLTLHSTEIGRSGGLNSPDSLTKDSIEWWGTYEAKYIITVSTSLRSEVIEHFKVPEWKVVAIPNGVDIEIFNRNVDRNRVRAKFGVNPDDKLILAVGRLVPQKGFQYLIKAMPIVLSKHTNVKLIIVGDGWMRSQLEYLIRKLGLADKVMTTGFVNDSELIDLYLSADVLVVPSLYEPFGMVALEGMAAGLPVVVSSIGGLRQIVEHNKTGIWVYPGDVNSIAWGIDYILSNPAHAKILANNAKKKAKEVFSWDAIAERTIDVYKKTIEW